MNCPVYQIDLYGFCHIVDYDTVKIVKDSTIVFYDTVRVALDTLNLNLLQNSHDFYSSAFTNLLAVAAILGAFFVFFATIVWNRKVELEVDKLKKNFSEVAEKKALETSISIMSKAKDELNSMIAKEQKNIQKEFEVILKEQENNHKLHMSILQKDILKKIFEDVVRMEDNLVVVNKFQDILNQIAGESYLCGFDSSFVLQVLTFLESKMYQLQIDDVSKILLNRLKETLKYLRFACDKFCDDSKNKQIIFDTVEKLESVLKQTVAKGEWTY